MAKLPPTTVFDQREAEDCLAFYQQHLRLCDWQIAIQIVKKADGLNHAYAADVDFRVYKKTALIRLMCEEDYDVSDVPQDHEFSVVHELVHLHYAPLEPLLEKCSPLSDVMLEQSVNALAGAIISMRRNQGVYCGIQEVSDARNDLPDAGSRGEVCERLGRR